jgi:tRNA A64-2'-O-ribosylphosphate transferase
MSDLKAVKKHAAQHDLFNRIHSIASDEQFVRNVAERWFNNRFKVVGERGYPGVH